MGLEVSDNGTPESQAIAYEVDCRGETSYDSKLGTTNPRQDTSECPPPFDGRLCDMVTIGRTATTVPHSQ